ncbi:endoglucanase-like protein [Delitschia confertaspora ATCC 74209]|uniref:Glucanase n=1 Tax=Delitschia confertaspora ATCC 74209 TaxID=1513339 RepID=A0A9P4JLX0_9PLEO|nr:endoglucanase-like protein [Delitschia confertaspora ATCC 74209]
MARTAFLLSSLLALAAAQTPGKTKEVHPKLQTWKCTNRGGCVRQNTAIVLDAASHWIHQANDTTKGCGNWGEAADKVACPDEATCAKNCIIEGISDYSENGITTQGGSLTLNMYGKNGVSSPRVYLLAEDEKNYELLKLVGKEFTFDVDASKLPCGMNGALYFSEMEKAGGRSKLNPGGAAYGTGYCDAQCYVTPWVNGVGNIAGKGICCNEMDIWEANKAATQMAPHTCSKPGLYQCTGDECKFDGVCDKNGCGNNPYVLGEKGYYGPGKQYKVDTTRPFTVVTQFNANSKKELESINRLYVQDGRVIQNAMVNVTGPMTDEYCSKNGAVKFLSDGAMKGMGGSLDRGMVLAMSVWWDEGGFMNWLDSGNAGPCNATEGDPKVIQQVEPRPAVVFSQIKWGEIGSTFRMKGRPHH